MPPTDQTDRELLCLRDNTTILAEDAECLHPSSRCDHRLLCPIVEAARERRRAEQ